MRRRNGAFFCTASFSVYSLRKAKFPIIYADLRLDCKVATHPPELVGRFDLIACFNKLDYESLKGIARLHMDKCLQKINALGHQLAIGDGVLGYIQRQGYSEKFGARPVRNAAMRILGGATVLGIGLMIARLSGALPRRG